MNAPTTKRPTVKHAMTATAFALVTARNAWRAWYRGYVAERRELNTRRR